MVMCVCVCSILNSVVIVLFLSGMVAMIMLRTLHKDIARYNQMDDSVSPSALIALCFRLFIVGCVAQW